MSAVEMEVDNNFVHSDSVLERSGLVVVSVLLLVGAALYFELESRCFLLCFGFVAHYTAVGHSGVVVGVLLLS